VYKTGATSSQLLVSLSMYFLYEVLLHLVFFLALPYFLLIGFMRGKYLTNLRERLGHYRSKRSVHDLWMHAVSVGEAMAAKPILDRLWKERPELRVVVTTTTITGQATARRLYPSATIAYFPFDFSRSVKRFLRHFSPSVFATMETEIWPNVARISRSSGLRLILANGRISDRSFPRYRLLRWFVAPVIAHYERILARETIDRERFIAIGASRSRVEVVGNVKFDFARDSSPLDLHAQVLRISIGRPVAILGSIVEAEEDLILPAIESLVEKGWFIIIAPRKPERFEVFAGRLAAANLQFQRRSDLSDSTKELDVLLLDSIGELARLYASGSVAFVGGSLAPVGGHNPIEPAVCEVPVAFGPHMSNFREIAAMFLASGGAEEVPDAAGLVTWCERVRSDDSYRKLLIANARQTVDRNQGASERTARAILELLP